MSRKRMAPDAKSPVATLAEQLERALLAVIRGKGDVGMWTWEIKKETGLDEAIERNKRLKSLMAQNKIKEVPSIYSTKFKKLYMASEFEPTKEITGGDWYVDGKLDTEFIDTLKRCCTQLIRKQRTATVDGITEVINHSGVLTVGITSQRIEEIVQALVLDDEVVELESDGTGEFGRVPAGKVCYKCRKRGGKNEPGRGAMASVPCGVCPERRVCSPDGRISPKTCKHLSEWLSF